MGTFDDILVAAGIDLAHSSVEDIRLNQKLCAITIAIASDDPLSEEQIALIERSVSEKIPGYSITVLSSSNNDAPASSERNASDPVPVFSVAPVVPTGGAKQSGDIQILMGKAILSSIRTEISQLIESQKTVIISGRAVSVEPVEFHSKKPNAASAFRVQLNITDGTDSIYCSCSFLNQEKQLRFLDAAQDANKKDLTFVVRGVCRMPKYAKELYFFANDVNAAPTQYRQDATAEKRVELHLHSRMSTMDALTDVTKAFQMAKRFGHKALAITDHGVVQAYPEAAKASKATGVKAVFGVEGYLLPDCELIPAEQTYVVFDIETTGLKPESAEIIEIGAVKIQNGQVIDRFSSFVNDGVIIPPEITNLTRITNEMIASAPTLRSVLAELNDFSSGCCLVAHNADFDMGFIRHHGTRFGLSFDMPYADTLMLSRYLLHDLPNHKLDTVCDHYGVDISGHHRAVDDAEATAKVFLFLMQAMQERGVTTVPVHMVSETPEEAGENAADGALPRKKRRKVQRTNHIILIAKTQAGMKNLYRLVSYAHLDHFHTHPRIPRSLLSIYRQDILLGSACVEGELYQAIVKNAPEEKIVSIAKRYDYLEIQPLCNNAFMIREGIVPDEEALREINRRIVRLGEELSIPVAATGDVHFLEPGDAVYRMILNFKQGYKDAEHQTPLYFKTTDEMLAEFAYLGEAKAREVVIGVPNRIADLCEPLKPFPDGTHAPVIPDAENELTNMAVSTAHGIYGDPLPEVVQARLDRELRSIIGNGFASLYLMAQRLVSKSLSDGYLVGSRGSVGSSFVATMAGITEVNPLQPHYVCPSCHFSDFDVDRAQYAAGVDMPDRDCPNCGTKLKKQGFDIPFEVFLGFKGDKTPDIDLNFSGEYQPVAHKYVEEMFGVGHAFRAGTISGLAERTGFDCVVNYAETNNIVMRKAEMERLSQGCLNVKVTTGQHPGGIVIVPKNDDILDYTPIQYPADKKDKNTITTHFDFHSMDDRLVKLDILGHDDPTALRMLEDLTGLNPRTIPLDDPDTRGIYCSSAPLGIDLSDMDCRVGTLGVPEFGTGFVRGVLELTMPTKMEELIRIAGLTHGTDVWLNNAEPLVTGKIATLSEVLCTRDDIMNYLIAHGMDASVSFKIMERVRKGKGLTPEMEADMQQGNIPAWFVDSCKKIKYMFPRGHAVAYAMMSFRIAYYKVHYPLEFYAVYYTVRADAFDVTLAVGGAERVLDTIRQIERSAKFKDFSERKKDKELQTILEVVYEMNLRGIALLPVDIYKSQATKFLIEDGAIRPPFNALPGVGATAAIALVENRGTDPFLSIEDFQKRTKANSGVIAMLEKCGCFGALPKSNQISLFS